MIYARCRQTLQDLCPLLHTLCAMATNDLEALDTGMQAHVGPSQPPASAKHAKQGITVSNSEDQSGAYQEPSEPSPPSLLGLIQLSILLTTIKIASEGLKTAKGLDKASIGSDCCAAMAAVREMVQEITPQHAQLFNDALEYTCRYAAWLCYVMLVIVVSTPAC